MIPWQVQWEQRTWRALLSRVFGESPEEDNTTDIFSSLWTQNTQSATVENIQAQHDESCRPSSGHLILPVDSQRTQQMTARRERSHSRCVTHSCIIRMLLYMTKCSAPSALWCDETLQHRWESLHSQVKQAADNNVSIPFQDVHSGNWLTVWGDTLRFFYFLCGHF